MQERIDSGIAMLIVFLLMKELQGGLKIVVNEGLPSHSRERLSVHARRHQGKHYW
jgi:hypothetical protein